MTRKPFGVLVLHGFTSSLDCVSGVEAAIRALGLPTRMPVLRGHGAESPEALRGVVWRDWLADARSALQDLRAEADRVIVVGLSMGALLALTLAADAAAAADGVIDSLVLVSPAIHMTSPYAPGRPFAALVPLMQLLFPRWDFPSPIYADPALARFDTNYTWVPTAAIGEFFALIRATRRRLAEVRVPTLILHSRRDSTADPRGALMLYRAIATPPDQTRIVWFEVTDHEMFRDCEREAAIQTVVEYVRERTGI